MTSCQCRYTHLSNNVNCSITRYPPCANQNTSSETPPVDVQTTKKIFQMDSKSPKSPIHSERTGVQTRNCGRNQLVDFLPGYHHTSSSYSETISTGATTHAYTNNIIGIETDMVHVTLSLINVTATPNRIRVKYPDVNIA